MALEEDLYKLTAEVIGTGDVQKLEKAEMDLRTALEGVAMQMDYLGDAFEAGTVSQAEFAASSRQLAGIEDMLSAARRRVASAMNDAAAATDRSVAAAIREAGIEEQVTRLMDSQTAAMVRQSIAARDLGRSRSAAAAAPLAGSARTAAMAQAGFGVANLAQDVIQGGPASGVNNLIFLASQHGIRSLASEFVAAAGGAAALSAAVATVGANVAIVAGAGFLVLNNALKEAKLDWSDLGDIVQNTAIWTAAGDGITATGLVLNEFGITQKSVGDAILRFGENLAGPLVANLAAAAVGWEGATEAVRRHKEEVARTVAQLKEYKDAQQALKQFKSDEQEEASRRGKLVGEALANMGGGRGIQGIIDDIARDASAKGGEEKITRGDETRTRAEWAKMDATRLVGKATEGDQGAIGRLRPMLTGRGDLTGFEAGAQGRDLKKEFEDEYNESERAMAESDRRARAFRMKKERAAKDLARDEADYTDEDQRESDRLLQKRRRDGEKAARDRQAEIGKIAGLIGPGQQAALSAAMAKHEAAGLSEAESDASLRGQLAGRLTRIDPAKRQEVADRAVALAREKREAKKLAEAANLDTFGNKRGPVRGKAPRSPAGKAKFARGGPRLPKAAVRGGPRVGGVAKGAPGMAAAEAGAAPVVAVIEDLRGDIKEQTEVLAEIARNGFSGGAV